MTRHEIFEEFDEVSDEIDQGPMTGMDYPEGYFEALETRRDELSTVTGALLEGTADDGDEYGVELFIEKRSSIQD